MAIDFSGYASNYAGGGAPGGTGSVESNAGGVLGTSIGLGIGAIPNFQERYEKYRKKDITKSTNPYLQAAMGVDSDGKSMDISQFSLLDDAGNSTYKDAVRSFVDYKRDLEAGTGGKNQRFGRKSERKGLVNVKDYINSHNEEMSFVAPMIGEKIMAYARDNFKTDDDMKEFIRERGLGQFIHDNFREDPANPNPMNAKLKEWATPDETWGQFFSRKGFTGGGGQGAAKVGGTTLGLASLGYGAYQSGKGIKLGYEMYGKGADLKTKQFNDLTKLAKESGLGSKASSKVDKAAKRKLTSSKSTLTKAQKKFNAAEKAYKGKTFSKTKDAKRLKKAVDTAKTAVSSADRKIGKATGNILKRAIDKHGSKKVMRLVARHLGWKGAVKFMSKLGLSGVMQLAPGLGMAASAALLTTDIILVYNIIAELAN